jgi:hypothetical protein
MDIGVRVYDWIHGKDAPFMPGTTEPKQSAQDKFDKNAEQERKKREQAGGAGKRANIIDAAERKATGYAQGGPVAPKAPVPYQDGGAVQGPGGPTADAIPANLSNGEYVIRAPVVAYLGTAFFDRLVEKAMAEMQRGAAAPGQWDQMAQAGDGSMTPGG